VRPVDRYEAFLLDLDGVLYRGDQAIPGAVDTVRAVRDAGRRPVFVTNNSWRTTDQVAQKLEEMGIPATSEDVVTSAQATAALLTREAGEDRETAYVLGGEGVREALHEAGIETVDGEPDSVGFVVVGWDGELTYDRLRTATVLVGQGARLVATNADASYPAPGGELWPGAGAILAAVETGTGHRATVVGKPHRSLFDLATDRAGTRTALVVGDRIETDIAGASAADLDSALVLTGASTAAGLLDADATPTGIVDDLRGLVADRPWAAPRRANASDLEAVWALAGRPVEGPGWGPGGVWVIDDGGVLATAATEARAGDAYLRAVATRQDLRGMQLGSQVTAAAVRDAARHGAARAWLLTETAEGFFARLGFDRCPRSDLPSWIVDGPGEQCPVSAVPMRRDLAQNGS
jgi:glycerol 3-phosphatase-2